MPWSELTGSLSEFPDTLMTRNLVICCDGTNNQFGPENTNVVRLVQVLDRDPVVQRLYYDPGVGTLPEPGVFTRFGKRISEWIELAFGTDLLRKVGQAYTYLMNIWEQGDQVFLFGFSRGAYTVRVLAGLLHTLGLMPRGSDNMVPYVLRLFQGMRFAGARSAADANAAYWRLCDEFRSTFARPTQPGDNERRFPVHFLGVWDTVSSVGWVWDPAKYRYTAHNPGIAVIRHAVSVDERRWFFRQNLMGKVGNQDFQQRWFPGVHGDIGGGYPETEGGLWRVPFAWIVDEAKHAGLLVDPSRWQAVWEKSPVPERPWDEPPHESLTPLWWLAEFFPKIQRRPGGLPLPRLGLGRHRHIPVGEMIHESTLRRLRETKYAPPNFSQAFQEKIRALPEVPEALPFEE
jgi:uncharacterized protein (DUF2235 family)